MKNYLLPSTYAGLILMILGTSAFYFTLKPNLPEKPDLEIAPTMTPGPNDDPEKPAEVPYKNLGMKPIFKTIIARPTPTPTPTPTPKPYPAASQVLKQWSMVQMMTGWAEFEDKGDKSGMPFRMNVNDIRQVKVGKQTIPVKLIKVDTSSFSAILAVPPFEGSTDFKNTHSIAW